MSELDLNSQGRKERVSTYTGSGVDRIEREKSRALVSQLLKSHSNGSHSLELPFSRIFPWKGNDGEYHDLQIEGVGTKVLLAELARDYSTIGIDGVAMVVNDVIRSGATPFLLSDVIHISKSVPGIVKEIVTGVEKGSKISGAILCAGETGDVKELLHHPLSNGSLPFDLIVSCLGMVAKEKIIKGNVAEGDCILGIESSGIHSNGLTLARKLLLKNWGGEFDPDKTPEGLARTILRELLEPTRIYVAALLKAIESAQVKAAVHITGDGYAKFSRIVDFQKNNSISTGFSFKLHSPSGVFNLVYETAKKARKPLTLEEMYMTFNMGFGFGIIVHPRDADLILDLLNKYYPAEKIGVVTRSRGIKIELPRHDKPLVLSR